MNTIGENIREARKKCGMTQDQLAAQLHTTKAAISRYELGQRTPNIIMLSRIAKLTGTTVHELVDEGYWGTVPLRERKAAFSDNPDEKLVASMFSELNEEGQQRAIEYLEMLVASEKYKRLEK